MGANKGVGVHQSYKDEAAKGCDVLFHVSIKGRHMLVDDIPLHMSIKIFKSMDEFDLDELKAYVKEKDISSPDPQSMIFKPIIFTSEHTGLKYYMLKIEGMHPKYKALYDKYDKVGNVYKQFMTHVTIDKEIYEDIKENGITADDIEFSHLVLEKGAGNTYHDFGKSEVFNVEQPMGKNGVSAELVRETVSMHADLAQKYSVAVSLKGDDLRRFVEDNPTLESSVMEKHQKRLEHHFGNNEDVIQLAWEKGIREAYKKFKKE